MKRLKGFDALMYYSENKIAPQHVLGMMVLDPSSCPDGRFDRESLETLLLSRIDQLDIFRKKIVRAPVNLAFPAFVDDPNFRIENHVKHIALPKPGSASKLAEIISDIEGLPLNMDRPLWEMTLIEGYQDGKYCVVVTKTHHCLMDGVGGAQMMPKLLDSKPVAVPRQGDLKTNWASETPSTLELWLSDLKSLRGDYSQLAATVGKLGTSLAGKALHAVRQQVSSLSETIFEPESQDEGHKEKPSVLQRETPDPVPRLYFNRALTPARCVAFGDMPMDGIKEIRRALKLTFNDVILGICSVALRHFLQDHQALPEGNIVATMPISIRGDLDAEGLNQLKIVQAPLPIQSKDPLKALKRTGAIMDNIKAMHASRDPGEVKLSKLVTPRIGVLLGHLYGIEGLSDYVRFLKTNLAFSTIPGPPMPLYMGGAKLLSICPVGPLADGVGLTISVMTYEGVANFTITACPDYLPDVQSLAEHIRAAYEDLLQSVRGAAKTKTKARTRKATVAKPRKTAPASKQVTASKSRDRKKGTKTSVL